MTLNVIRDHRQWRMIEGVYSFPQAIQAYDHGSTGTNVPVVLWDLSHAVVLAFCLNFIICTAEQRGKLLTPDAFLNRKMHKNACSAAGLGNAVFPRFHIAELKGHTSKGRGVQPTSKWTGGKGKLGEEGNERPCPCSEHWKSTKTCYAYDTTTQSRPRSL